MDNAYFWGQVEAHLGYERLAPVHWTYEAQKLWYKGYDSYTC